MVVRQSQNMSWDSFQLETRDEPVADEAASRMSRKNLSELFRLPNIFVQITKYICPNCPIYLFRLSNLFVQIAKYICSN